MKVKVLNTLSARLERFLQLAAENNSTVVNLSSSSNYFHLLRAQAASLDSQEMRPLIVMSPKSLLRNKTVAKPIDEFTSGGFKPIITEEHDAEKVKKVILASGKMFIDLKEHLEKNPDESTLIVAVERDYIHSLKKKFKKYLNHYLKKYHGFKKSLKPRCMVIRLSLS